MSETPNADRLEQGLAFATEFVARLEGRSCSELLCFAADLVNISLSEEEPSAPDMGPGEGPLFAAMDVLARAMPLYEPPDGTSDEERQVMFAAEFGLWCIESAGLVARMTELAAGAMSGGVALRKVLATEPDRYWARLADRVRRAGG